MIDLTISIVNTNNRDFLDKCLASIFESAGDLRLEVIVVDNHSDDGSAEMVRANYPDAELITNSSRMGFSANNNQALRRARGKYAMILNEDTVIGGGCLGAMFRYMEERPDVGALGPRILNPDGSLQQSVFRMPTLSLLFFNAFFLGALFPGTIRFGGYKKWPHNAEAEVPFLSGACIMFPTEAIRKVGYMDDRFFIYAEDPDICKRIREAGRRVVFLPDAEIIHHGGSTFTQESDSSLLHRLNSTHFFFRKHYGLIATALASFLILAGALNRVVVFSLLPPVSGPRKREALLSKKDFYLRIVKLYFRRLLGKTKVQ